MKKQQIKIATILFLFSLSQVFAQGVTRIIFSDLGNKPIKSNQFIQGNSGGSTFTTNSESNEARVKEIIKAQKEAGFKEYKIGTFLLSNINSLQAAYPIETGFTYRIFSVFRLPDGTSILRAKDKEGKEYGPEIQSEGYGSIFSYEQSQLQLNDIVSLENKYLFIENGLVSDKTINYATTYIVFKKKS